MYSIRKIRFFIPKKPNSCVPVRNARTPWKCNPIPKSHTGMYSEPVPIVPDTPVDSATLYLHKIRVLIVVIVSCFKLFFFRLCDGFAHSPQGSSINLNVQHSTHSFDCQPIP